MASFDYSRAGLLVLASIASGACGDDSLGEREPSSTSNSTQGELRQARPRCPAPSGPRAARVTDLGVLDPDTLFPASHALALNDAGTVVGYSSTQISPDLGALHAFKWQRHTGMVDLGTLGGENSFAIGVNDRDQVAGNAQAPDGYHYAVVWDAQGRIHNLGTLGGRDSHASGINNRGQVVGESENARGQYRAFIWHAHTGMVDLGLPEGDFAYLHGINDSEVVIGAWVVNNGPAQPFKWTREEGPSALDLLGGISGEAYDINARGEIVGYIYDQQQFVAVKWAGDRAWRVADLPGPSDAYPRAINQRGVIAGGDTTNSGSTAIRWTSSDRVERLSIDAIQSDAFAINDSGAIAGDRLLSDQTSAWRAFLWEPRWP
ncbi:MAG TPA: hypothetical protein VJV79_28720 [Polyangiaceae bacterium]|nr:hypothetical protein [Polyangiaceae bacterium]